MSYGNNITKSLFGRQIGLQQMTTPVTGGVRQFDVVVGPEDIRQGVSTGESTGTNLAAFGVSRVFGTSAASTPVYTLDPPVPGVRKGLHFASTDSAIYVKMASGCAIAGTSLATTGATVIRSSGGGYVELMGITTALFCALELSSTAINGLGFQATT